MLLSGQIHFNIKSILKDKKRRRRRRNSDKDEVKEVDNDDGHDDNEF